MTDQRVKALPGELPEGTQIGSWRVVDALGQGGYGTVHGVERVGPGETGRFALKLARWPRDPRFEREAQLLSRIRHPRVPRLVEHGWWSNSGGVDFPYLVMDRIDGVSLYEWAREHAPTSLQVLRVLADVAWALDAVHRADCVHRDVKGGNVLVSAEGRAFLMDFGAGDFKGAQALTHPELDALILRMLSDAPEARGSAGELARALEHAANTAGPGAEVPIVTCESEPAMGKKRAPSPRRGRIRKVLGATVAMMGLLLAVISWWRAHPNWQWPGAEHEGRHSDSEDGGVVAVGDAGPFVATHSLPHRASSAGLEKDMPKKPFPGQRLPPCREGFEVEIELTEGQQDTRSCWIKGTMSAAACKASGFEYRGACYAPSYPPPKLPLSERP